MTRPIFLEDLLTHKNGRFQASKEKVKWIPKWVLGLDDELQKAQCRQRWNKLPFLGYTST